MHYYAALWERISWYAKNADKDKEEDKDKYKDKYKDEDEDKDKDKDEERPAVQGHETVTVTSNAISNPTVVLRITGRVLEQPTEAMPEKKDDAGSPVNKQ